MRRRNIIVLLLGITALYSCDPALQGDLKVFNESASALTVVANIGSDTLSFTIAPGDNKTIRVLDGIGNQKSYNCCPCEFSNIDIETINGDISKDPNSTDNWTISNKAKQKKFGGEDLKCEFRVTQSDI